MSCDLCRQSWAEAMREAWFSAQILPITVCAFVCSWGNGLCVILNDVANWRSVEAQDILKLCVERPWDPRILEMVDMRIEEYSLCPKFV